VIRNDHEPDTVFLRQPGVIVRGPLAAADRGLQMQCARNLKIRNELVRGARRNVETWFEFNGTGTTPEEQTTQKTETGNDTPNGG
jgi:hypothetical protein